MNGFPSTALANANYYDGFYKKFASVVQTITQTHMFDNGNKRTAEAVFEVLQIRNEVYTLLSRIQIQYVITRIAEGLI